MAANKEKAKGIFEKVLKSIKTTEQEMRTTTANVNMLMHRLKEVVGRDVELRVAGSIARGTNLRGSADIDIFMLFKSGISRKRLESLGLKYGKAIAKREMGERYEIKYAEHPYVRIYLPSGLNADIVPAFKIESAEELATAVDRTPLHTDFINTHLSAKQRDDVRLLKYFLKAHNIYGAESRIGGFSGYICELLIYHYGSIIGALNAFSSMKLPITLDPLSKEERREHEKRFGSEFVVIDPVDKNRNVAAAVSIDALARLSIASRLFLSKPDIKAFYGQKVSHDEAAKLLKKFMLESKLDLFLIALSLKEKSADVTWPQLRKISSIIEETVKRYGFEVYLSAKWVSGKYGLILLLAPKRSLGYRLFKGPSAFTSAASDFIHAHHNAAGFLTEKGLLYALDRNRYGSVEEIITEMLHGGGVKGRKDVSVKGAKLFVNAIPAKYAEAAYLELMKKLRV